MNECKQEIQKILFQFHKVQLKVSPEQKEQNYETISIP